MKELGVSGDGRARCPYRAETLNSELIEGTTFYSPRQKSTVERRSRVILQGTAETYAILRIWLYVKPPKFQKKLNMWGALRV